MNKSYANIFLIWGLMIPVGAFLNVMFEMRFSWIDEMALMILLAILFYLFVCMPLGIYFLNKHKRETPTTPTESKDTKARVVLLGLVFAVACGGFFISRYSANPYRSEGLSLQYSHPGASGSYTHIEVYFKETQLASWGETDAYVRFEDKNDDGLKDIVFYNGNQKIGAIAAVFIDEKTKTITLKALEGDRLLVY